MSLLSSGEPTAAVPPPAPAPKPSASAVVSPAPKPKPTASVARPTPLSLLERAAGGDEKAIGELEGKAANERSLEEVLVMGKGRVVRTAIEVEALAKRVQADSSLLDDPNVRKEVKRYVADRSVSDIALRMLATTDNPVGADLLYYTWVRNPKRTPTTQLAEELLYSKEVRPKASEELSIALDLRKAETCEDNKAIVKRALEKADRRALHLIVKRTVKTGCGDNKREDCYPCLRDGKLLKETVKAVANRPAPKL